MITRKTKMKWLKALRSDNYNINNNGPMKTKNTYNVLGVLCEATGNSKNRNMRSTYPRTSSGEVQEFLGLSSATQTRLVGMESNLDSIVRYISRNIKAR